MRGWIIGWLDGRLLTPPRPDGGEALPVFSDRDLLKKLTGSVPLAPGDVLVEMEVWVDSAGVKHATAGGGLADSKLDWSSISVIWDTDPSFRMILSGFLGAQWNMQGMEILRGGNPSQAIVPLEKALALTQEAYGPVDHRTGAVLANLGEAARITGNLSLARDSYLKALDILLATRSIDHPELQFVSSLLQKLADAAAIHRFREATASEKAGLRYLFAANLEKAASAYTDAQVAYLELGMNEGAARSHSTMAAICLRQGEAFEAEKHVVAALDLSEETAESSSAKRLEQQGELFAKIGDLGMACVSLSKSRVMAEKDGDTESAERLRRRMEDLDCNIIGL